MPAIIPVLRHLFPPWVRIIILLCLTITLTTTDTTTAYLRQQISHGEIWRLISCHFTHLDNAHLVENMTGLLLLNIIVRDQISSIRWLLLTLFCALFISLFLYLFEPLLEWYVGFSGVLHGLFAAGLMTAIQRREATIVQWLLLMLLMAKLGWEQLYGPLPGSNTVAGINVVVDAHLYGAVVGALYLIVVEWPQRSRAAKAQPAD